MQSKNISLQSDSAVQPRLESKRRTVYKMISPHKSVSTPGAGRIGTYWFSESRRFAPIRADKLFGKARRRTLCNGQKHKHPSVSEGCLCAIKQNGGADGTRT